MHVLRRNLLKKIKENALKEIEITFIKKDGTLRKMKCMYGVKKENSKGMNYNAEEKGLISVFDLEKQEYRVVPIATTKALLLEGKTYEVKDKVLIKRRL